MTLTLSENIRALRRQRRLTQEQFAEVLGVTAGAVYKWEAGLSVPELELIVGMADFFDLSVDALLGYEPKDNRLDTMKKRLGAYCLNRDPEALNEAEKALKKYPHSFEVVHACAEAYLSFGIERRSPELLRRALALLEQSLPLIAQNSDPELSEYTIYGEMGCARLFLGEPEKGLELLKKHNMGGIFSDMIGVALSMYLHRSEEAEPYLSETLLESAGRLTNAVAGYAFLFAARGDYASEREIVAWGQTLLLGLKAADRPSFLDKMQAVLLALLAHAQLRTGAGGEARASLRAAAGYVRRFDDAPDYSLSSVRFASVPECVMPYDGLGTTAAESVAGLIGLLGEPALEAMWKEEIDHA